jgi:hypothetical protein
VYKNKCEFEKTDRTGLYGIVLVILYLSIINILYLWDINIDIQKLKSYIISMKQSVLPYEIFSA